VDTRRRDRGKIVRGQRAVTRSATVRRRQPHGCHPPRPRRLHFDDPWPAITIAAAPFCAQNSTCHRPLMRPPDESRLPHLQRGSTDTCVDGRLAGLALFLNACLTVVGLTRHTRAISPMPLALRLLSIICRFTDGMRPWYTYSRINVPPGHVAC
jgi:hypothetical protein